MQKTQVISPVMPGYLQPGEIIADRYRLERELGRGSMGTVWQAAHVTLGQRVAIKLIASENVESPEARLRFSTEAKAAARLRSRHVVQVIDDGQTVEGMPYIVMEFLEGETVEEKLERIGALPLAEAVRIATHVCRALSRAHAQGIVHRDLKPANIFLAKSEDDELGWIAKVLDFGVAKLLGDGDASTTKTGTLVGTPLFMSPEQVRGASRVDGRADVYSLGMVFYNMVTGTFAFDAPSYSDVLIKICLEPLPDIREVAPWVSEPLRQWFQKACAREPAERFQSADQAIEALHEAVGQQPLDRDAPDQIMGPSGTVVGYAPPDSLGGTLVLDGDATSPPLSSGTAVIPPQVVHRPSSVRPWAAPPPASSTTGKRPVWPLFLAAGAGLGLTCAGVAILLIVAQKKEPETTRRAERAVPTVGQSARSGAAAITTAPLPAATAPAAEPPLAAVPSALPTSTASTPPAPRPATAARPAGSARRAPTKKPAPKGGTPDIGF
jgi:serine/threonine-protein kinase